MLPADVLRRMIAGEFLRVGASHESWAQNFPEVPSIPAEAGRNEEWVREVIGPPISSEGVGRSLADLIGVGGTTLGPPLMCPPGTTLGMIGDMQACIAIPGYVPPVGGDVFNPDADQPVQVQPAAGTRPSSAMVLPPFVGGALGRVLFTPIANRNLSGIRYGTLPRVIFEGDAPGSFGGLSGVQSTSGGMGDIQP